MFASCLLKYFPSSRESTFPTILTCISKQGSYFLSLSIFDNHIVQAPLQIFIPTPFVTSHKPSILPSLILAMYHHQLAPAANHCVTLILAAMPHQLHGPRLTPNHHLALTSLPTMQMMILSSLCRSQRIVLTSLITPIFVPIQSHS